MQGRVPARQVDGERRGQRPGRRSGAAGKDQEGREVGCLHPHRPAGRRTVEGVEQDRARGREDEAGEIALDVEGERRAVLAGLDHGAGSGQPQPPGLAQGGDVVAAEPAAGPRRRQRGIEAVDPPDAGQERDVEIALAGSALGAGTQRIRFARFALQGQVEGEPALAEALRQEAGFGQEAALQQGEQRRRLAGGHAALDPARPVRRDPPGELRARPREVGDVEGVDDEARAVRLQTHRDGAVARIGAGGSVADVARPQRQTEIVPVQTRHQVSERRQFGDVDAAGGELRVEAPAPVRVGPDVAGIAGDAGLAQGEAQVAQREVAAGRRKVGAEFERAPVEDRRDARLRTDPAEIASERLRVAGGDVEMASEAGRARQLGLAGRRDARRSGRRALEAPEHEPARAVERAAERDAGPVVEAERHALGGEVEIEQHRRGQGTGGQPLRQQAAPAAGDEQAVEVEATGAERQAETGLAQIEAAAAREPRRLAAGIELDLDRLRLSHGAARFELCGQGEREDGAGRLDRRSDGEAGRALRLRHEAAARPATARFLFGLEGDAGIELQAGHGVAAARELHREAAVAAGRAGGEMERAPLRRPLRQPWAGQGRSPQPQVLGGELFLRRCAGPRGGDGEAPDAQVVDHDVAPERLRVARQ